MENSTIAIIVLAVLIVIGLIFLIVCLLKGGGSPKNLQDFEGLTLVQPDNFYKNKRDDTLKYLKEVYPTSKLDNLSDIDLAKLYNSLWTWYNCESSFGPTTGPWLNNVDSQACWQALPGCGDKWPKLPYVPQGWIYDWNTYIGAIDKESNKYSDVGKSDSYQSYNVISQINYSDSTKHPKDVTGSVPGQTYWNWFNGPNPIWMYQRAIFRYNYNPGLGGSYTRNYSLYTTPALTPGDITDENLPIPWNCPQSWWTGVPSNHYLEVTMASEPGLAPSPPICWFDGWRGSGTWINVGKTMIARNKVDGVFKLASEAAQTQAGRKQLMSYFNTDKPYEVCKNLVRMNNQQKCPINGPLVYDGRRNSTTYQKKVKLNFCNPGGTNAGSVVGYFANTNANMAYQFGIIDWYDWCGDETSPMPDDCVDKMRLGTHYMADRQAAIMTFDEPLFALGTYLGYDSIQMPHSSNGNGRYQYEYLELRGYPPEVRNRDYSSFMMAIDTIPGSLVDYRVDFLVDYMPKMAKLFSLRDVLDPLNGDSKPVVVDADWADSVRVPKKRPPAAQEDYKQGGDERIIELIKHQQKVNAEFAKESQTTGLVSSKEYPSKPTSENSTWSDDGCPVNKFALGSLWEYNITAKGHISSMFTYLSIAFSDSVDYCAPNGKGRSSDVGVYSKVKDETDAPYA